MGGHFQCACRPRNPSIPRSSFNFPASTRVNPLSGTFAKLNSTLKYKLYDYCVYEDTITSIMPQLKIFTMTRDEAIQSPYLFITRDETRMSAMTRFPDDHLHTSGWLSDRTKPHSTSAPPSIERVGSGKKRRIRARGRSLLSVTGLPRDVQGRTPSLQPFQHSATGGMQKGWQVSWPSRHGCRVASVLPALEDATITSPVR